MEIFAAPPMAIQPSNRSPRVNKIQNLSSHHIHSPTSPSRIPPHLPSNRLKQLSECKRRREKVLLMKPRQLTNLSPCVYKEQCREARIQFEVIKQKRALKKLLQSEEDNETLKSAEEKEIEKNKLNELRYLQIKNFSILFIRSTLKKGKKRAIQRYKQMALEKLLLREKQVAAVQKIIQCWKNWRIYKHSLAFRLLFQLFELHLKMTEEDEERIFQQRIEDRRQMEHQYQLRVEELRGEYLKNLQQLKLNQSIQIFPSLAESSTKNTAMNFPPPINVSPQELYHWCDPKNEIYHSMFNTKQYREWKEKYRIPDPPSCVVHQHNNESNI